MTVGELIASLKGFDQALPVVMTMVDDDGDWSTHIAGVSLQEETVRFSTTYACYPETPEEALPKNWKETTPTVVSLRSLRIELTVYERLP